MKEIETKLPDNTFIRTHRSHLVNIKLIKKVTIKPSGSGYVVLSNDNAVALSKAHKKAVKTCLQQVAYTAFKLTSPVIPTQWDNWKETRPFVPSPYQITLYN